MYLLTNSAQPDSAYVALADSKGVIVVKKIAGNEGKRPVLLKEIDAMLLQHDLTPQQLKGVIVVTGPGHFSFLRTGIVIANTFGWVLNIPVVGVMGDALLAEELWDRARVDMLQAKEYVQVNPEYGRERTHL